jgi:hypothetical protein
VFHRDEPSGVRQVIILDLSTKRRCVYVIVGLNAASIAGAAPADEAGVYVSKYLGPQGMSEKPVCFPVFDRGSARSALEKVKSALETHGLGWLGQFRSLSDFADALAETYDMFKGELYLQEGRRTEAETWLRRYEARLLAMEQTSDVIDALTKTRGLLAGARPNGP